MGQPVEGWSTKQYPGSTLEPLELRPRLGDAADRATRWLVRGLPKCSASASATSEAWLTMLAELALLCVVGRARGAPRESAAESLEALAVQLRAAYERFGLATMFSRETRLAFIAQLLIWLAGSSAGQELTPSRRELADVVRETNLFRLPRPAFRIIELRYFLTLGGFPVPARPSLGELLACTGAVQPLRAEWVEESELYELTHLCFYLTDFGARPDEHLGGDLGRKLADDARTLLPRCIDEDHLDLVAELALALQCLERDACAAQEAAWEYVLERQRAHGGFRPPPAAGGDGSPEGVFLASYHPAVVVALAGRL